MPDNLKTIREALDKVYAAEGGYELNRAYYEQARAALDALEAELDLVEGLKQARIVWQTKVSDLQAELATLQARLAPADSAPGNEELAESIALFRGQYATEVPVDYRPLLAAAEAHLRSQQPETEGQRAERLLGEWRARAGNDGYILSERNGWHGCSLFSTAGPVAASEGRTRAAAILNALAKARDAEGGKS